MPPASPPAPNRSTGSSFRRPHGACVSSPPRAGEMASEATPEGVSLGRCTNVIAAGPLPTLPRKRERVSFILLAMRLCIRVLLTPLQESPSCLPLKEGRRSAERRTTGSAPPQKEKPASVCGEHHRLSPANAGSKRRRPRLSAPHRGHAPRGLTLNSAPGRASWNHRIQTGGPSPAPVQPAPGSPITRRTVDAQNRPEKGYKPHPGTAPAPSIGCHRSTSLRWASWPYVAITVTYVKTSSPHQ